MDCRMDRAESVFTGTAKSKVIADILFDEEAFKITGEGFACPIEGHQTLELNCSGTKPLPINWNIFGTIIQSNFRVFTQYRGSGMYDFFKTCFPGGMKVELLGSFTDGAVISGTSTISHVNDIVICRCNLKCEGFSEESPARAHDLGPTLPCYEVVDGIRADEVSSTIDLEWKDGDNQKYLCRLESTVRSAGSGNFAPARHFIGHHFKVTDKPTNNLHFAQRLKSRASVINYYKN
uniref:Putative nonfluorescent protein n=1 Tax=Ctenophora sp. B WRF-2014 TaxID=1567048 RepID=A0A1C8YXK2_9METZ|nr:putative nonfluorescent protein [Ctenophora sp. B WRF-2014]